MIQIKIYGANRISVRKCRMKNNYKTVFSFEVLLLWNRKVSICIRKNFVLEKMMDH